MFNYIVRRLLIGLVTLVLITFIVYALIRHMPGTPLTMDPAMMDPSKTISKEDLARLEKLYGLDKHWSIAYFQWAGNLLQGDLGRSFQEKRPVTEVIGRRIGPTLLLSVCAITLGYVIAIPIGLWSVVRRNQLDERIVSLTLYMLYSLPSFVAALWLLYIFYLKAQGTPFELGIGMVSDGHDEMSLLGKIGDYLKHMILPVFCATYAGLAFLSRFVKANMEEVVRQDYIRTAKAKGVPEPRIIVRHAFSNTMIPMVTQLGFVLPALVSGSIVLEKIFSWPGMGMLYIQALSGRDYPVIMGLTLMFSVLTLLGQLLADIAYAFVDPRVTYS